MKASQLLIIVDVGQPLITKNKILINQRPVSNGLLTPANLRSKLASTFVATIEDNTVVGYIL
jgi:hypothetical protein